MVPKYNPARTFTPEGAVGLGGAYMCIYPMDSPGGYQLIGRTLPIWNTFGRVGPFTPQKPWLLNNFDQARGPSGQSVWSFFGEPMQSWRAAHLAPCPACIALAVLLCTLVLICRQVPRMQDL